MTPELRERLDHLDRTRKDRPLVHGLHVDDDAALDGDVIIAGGGLWSLLAPILAERGLSVIVLERAKAGQAHREWNASERELQALVAANLATAAELEALIIARYRVGLCRFHGGPDYPVHGVLDRAVDAGALLAHARRLGEARGVRFLDGHTVTAEGSSEARVVVRANGTNFVGRLLVDARGASSPHASADLVCPTVGGVIGGLDIDPGVGEILATIDPIEDGRQHVWEAFPGRPRETTVYLFYYAHAEEPSSLATLYERFFDRLPTYKKGGTELIRPTFGYIPGWSRLSPAPHASGRTVLVGDAAARHSPLTYCGFGATLRSLLPAADAITKACAARGPAPTCIVDDAGIHSLTGALAKLLASRRFRGNALNELLDASFATLHGMNGGYARLLRDEMRPRELVTFLRKTAARHPAVWRRAMQGLGLRSASRWAFSVAKSLTDGV